MKISPRWYPLLITVIFISFVMLGLLLGFTPRHEGRGRPEGALPAASVLLVCPEGMHA